MSSERKISTSAADRVRESIDRLRTLPLDEIDKDLYELSLKADEKAAAEVRANLSNMANVTAADEAAIMETIQQVDSELEIESRKKTFQRQVLISAILIAGIAYCYGSATPLRRRELEDVCWRWLEVVLRFLKSFFA